MGISPVQGRLIMVDRANLSLPPRKRHKEVLMCSLKSPMANPRTSEGVSRAMGYEDTSSSPDCWVNGIIRPN